jgi:hypothetical protein
MTAPADIALVAAFEIRAEIGQPLDGGPGRYGHRRIIPITGGTVSGPRLTGRVLPGADFELIRADGNSRVEAHYGIEASDGTPLYVRNTGLFVGTPEVIARMDAGDDVSPADYYFRTSPVFDAPAGPHGWLADRIFVASCRFTPAVVTIRVFEVA